MKRLPFVILFVLVGSFITVRSIGNISDTKNPPGEYERIIQLIGQMMEYGHFNPQKIDDAFSQKVFKKFTEDLDGEKNIFLAADVATLKNAYGNKIDNEIKGDKVETFLAIGNVFTQRMHEVEEFYKEIIAKPFDFSVSETIMLNTDKIDFPKTDKERKEMWRKKLKFMTLERYVELQENREKNKGQKDFVVKTDKELEAEARDRVKKIIDRIFERYKFKFDDKDKFNMFINAITNIMDPHTEFMPPVDKRYFDEQMSGTFYGIGATLQYDEGNIKITSVVTGGPAAKSEQVQAGDLIIKVAEKDKEPVELIGYSVQDAVKVIRGKEGSIVTLTLRKVDGTVKTLDLVREKIVQDETFARSAVVQEGDAKIGYIYLPEFYANFEEINGTRSYIDVANEVEKLKAEHVDGIVIDLRNNGGGSLYDVVQMVGMFVDEGPVVQVKDRQQKANVLKNNKGGVIYTGPLAVMVNEFSASASEIFAAAIQDYGRGIVLGSTSTYGKGTVQRNIGLDPSTGYSSNSDLGSVKLTLQKFYRVDGSSTQLKGVVPDVVVPDQLEYLKLREKDDKNALEWDEIKASNYKKWNNNYDLDFVKQQAITRIANDARFNEIKKATEWLAEQEEKTYSLNINDYKKQQKASKEVFEKLNKLNKLDRELNVVAITGEEKRWANDEAKQARFEQWLKSLKTDIYLDQAVQTVKDAVTQENIAKAGKAGEAENKEVKRGF